MLRVRLAVPVVDGAKALLQVLECSLVIVDRSSANDRDSGKGQGGDKFSMHFGFRDDGRGKIGWIAGG